MKNLKKNSLKAVVMIALFCPAAFADGDMGGGGFADPNSPTKAEKVIRTLEDGDMGGGGRISNAGYLDTVYSFFDSMIQEIF